MHSPPVVYVGATGPVTECENVLTQVRGLGVNTCVCVLYVVRGVVVAVTFVKHVPFSLCGCYLSSLLRSIFSN